jgi:hypothetical protein
VRRDVGDVFAADVDAPAGDRLDAGDHPQHGALAAAGGAEDGEQFSVADVQAQVRHRHGAVRVHARNVVEPDVRHQSSRPRLVEESSQRW